MGSTASGLNRVRRTRPSIFRFGWLPALVGAVVVLLIALNSVVARTEIHVVFDSTAGVKVGVSKLRHNGVEMGTVSGIRFDASFRQVIVDVVVRKDATALLTADAIFWIDRSSFGTAGARDIAIRPGSSTSNRKSYSYFGEEDAPILKSNEKGSVFRINSQRIGPLWPGAPVTFREVYVGKVLGWDLMDLATSIQFHVFVRAPFDQYVRSESYFWRAELVSYSGSFDTTVSAVKAPGISFNTPSNSTGCQDKKIEFKLYEDEEAAKSGSVQPEAGAIKNPTCR